MCDVASASLLIVEDDDRISEPLARALRGAGYSVTRAATAKEAGELFATKSRFDLVLLDLGLPDGEGLGVCRALVDRDPEVSVIMLTARADELDIVVGLDAGAIDYITKPFSLAGLQARIRAQLRRMDAPQRVRAESDQSDDALVVNRATRLVTLNDVPLSLRLKEFDLLARLDAERGSVVSREVLMSDVWDQHWFGSTKTLDFHVGALRAKLGHHETDPILTTIRGVGFRLEHRPLGSARAETLQP